jgi:hypothetical protein
MHVPEVIAATISTPAHYHARILIQVHGLHWLAVYWSQ